MKKLLCLLLVAVMVLGLCACGSSDKDGDTAAKGLQVGYSRQSIHPENIAVPLAGYGNTDQRIANGFLDYIQATCIAFRDGEDTVLLYTVDMISAGSWAYGIREKVAEAVGIPLENVMISTTHTHSAPDMASTQAAMIAYRTYLEEQMLKAAQEAIADLAPAKLYGTSTDVEGMNFVRHYLMNDGTYYGSNFGSTASGYKDHAADNDPQMRLMKADREGDKKDVLMLSWAAHPCFTGGVAETNLSADYIAPLRDTVEIQTGMEFAFFQAAAGNQNTNSLIDSEKHTLDNNGYGQKLAEAAIAALPSMTELTGQGVQVTETKYEFAVNHEKEDMRAKAQEVVSLWKSSGSRDQGNALAVQYGLSSVYEADSILQRPSWPKTDVITLYATQVGGFSYVNAPYEMFADSAKHIKENSPFDMTFVITCSNGVAGYFATEDAYDYGCYESFTAYYARGVAEGCADQYVQMLKDLK